MAAKAPFTYGAFKKSVSKWMETLFVLREDVARDDKAGFYQTVLAKINTVRYHHEKSFKKRNGVSKGIGTS